MTTTRLQWKETKAPNGEKAWEAALPYGHGACYSIYRKGRRYLLVYWSGRSAVAWNHGPYATLLAAKRKAWRDLNWK